MDVRLFRDKHHITQPEVVDALKPFYPAFDKPLLSKVENPDRSGVKLIADAEATLKALFAELPGNGRRRDARRKTHKVQAWIDDSLLEGLQQLKTKYGCDTTTATIERLIRNALEAMENV